MSDAILDKVRALMAKAESSPYPAEAATFMAKAQALIDRYAIDEALLGGTDPSTVGHENVAMTGSYSGERASIWGAVARVNRCQVLTLSPYNSSAVTELTVIGRPHDREIVKVLATSLELQAMRRLADLALEGWESPVVQRRSFLRGFAGEVVERLRSTQTDEQVFGTAAAALALTTEAVDRYSQENFDVITRRSKGRHAGMAYSRGRRAGAVADVGAARLDTQRKALGR